MTPEWTRRPDRARRPGRDGATARAARPRAARSTCTALDEVRALLGDAPRRRDLLIEHLHLIQDEYGHLSAAHLAALAAEMKLALTEVYEVATFYAHFDVVKEGETPPPPVTVRVCDSLSCAMAGAEQLLARTAGHARPGRARRARALHGRLRPRAGLRGRPCAGDAARRSGQRRAPRSTHGAHAHACTTPRSTSTPIVPSGGYALLERCVSRQAHARRHHQGGRATPACAASAAPASRPAASGRWCAPSPAPRLMAVNGDEGEPGTFKDRHYLEHDPHRFIEGMLIAAWVVEAPDIYIYLRDEYPEVRLMLRRRDRQGRRGRACPAHQHPSAPRRRRLHLRRRIRDDRIDRRQARPAAPSPALRRAGRPVRPPDARAERRDAVLGARHRREGRRPGSPRRAAASARASAASRCRAA